MFKNLRTLLFGRKDRKKQRSRLNDFFIVRVQIGRQRFKFRDFSPAGFAVTNDDGHVLPMNSEQTANFLLYGQTKASVKVKVARMDGVILGFEVLDKKTFQEFSQRYLSLMPKS